MSIKIADNHVVRLAYRITDRDGRLMEERTPEDAYEYVHGRGLIAAPVERALLGKTVGHRAEISISPLEAYGSYKPQLVTEVSRDHFPPDLKIEVGMKFNTVSEAGDAMTIRVIEIDDDSVTVDGNHPLAGLDLLFEVRVLDVREATDAELASGSVGGPENPDDEVPPGSSLH